MKWYWCVAAHVRGKYVFAYRPRLGFNVCMCVRLLVHVFAKRRFRKRYVQMVVHSNQKIYRSQRCCVCAYKRRKTERKNEINFRSIPIRSGRNLLFLCKSIWLEIGANYEPIKHPTIKKQLCI